MAESQRSMDRRTLLKLMSAAGLSGAAASVNKAPFGATGMAIGPGTAPAGQAPAPAGIDPFEVRVADAELQDLVRRLQAPRWPPDSPGSRGPTGRTARTWRS